MELQPNPSKWNQVKKVSQRFASTTTVYGLTRVMKADSLFMKIVWALMTLLSLSVGSYAKGNALKEYLKYDVVTQTKRIYPQSILLPSVTFCSESNMLELIKTAVYDAPDMNGLTNLTGEYFVQGIKQEIKGGKYNCIKFNNYKR